MACSKRSHGARSSLLHDGLLVSPLPSQSTLARLNEESLCLAGLRNDDYPFLRITNLQDLYTQIVRQLPPITEQDLESLRAAIATVNLTHLRQPTTAPQALGGSTIPPPTTATLHAYFRRIGTKTDQPQLRSREMVSYA